MGGGGILSPDSLLEDYLLELSGKPRPRVGFLPTAGGERPEGIQWFYDAFAGRDCEPSHLELFGMPEEPAAWVAAQDVVYVCGGNTANALAIWRVHGVDVALREAWERGAVARRLERRRELLVRGLRHRLLRPAAARARRRARLSRRELLPPLRRRAGTAPDVHPARPGRRPPTRLRGRRRCCIPLRGHRAARGRQPARGRARLPRRSRRRDCRSSRAGCEEASRSSRARAATARRRSAASSRDGWTCRSSRSTASSTARTGSRRPTRSSASAWCPCSTRTAGSSTATYRRKLGDLVLERADIVVWLDLPLRVWLPGCCGGRCVGSEAARCSGTTTARRCGARSGAASRSFGFALRMHFERRRRYPVELAPYPHVRLRTPAAVARWLDDYSSSAISAAARDAPSVSTGR